MTGLMALQEAHDREERAQPRYAQLQQHIRERIEAGVWQPGDPIPGEKALAQQYAVARMTVRQALEGLIRAGLLVRVRGRGTYVARPHVERELSHMHGFSEDMRARGMVPSSRLLIREVVPAPPTVSAALQVGEREAVIFVQRLRLADALPLALETSYLRHALCRDVLHADLEGGSLYAFLQDRLRIELLHASQELQAALPSRAEADLLQITRRQPVLIIQQTTYVRQQQLECAAIVGRTVYRADRYRFHLEVPR
jgi:GntR family transcriptional regulator